MTEKDLLREFELYGPIDRLRLVVDPETGLSRGYAFIVYERERDMKAAYKDADGLKMKGKRLLIDVERGRTVKGWKPRRLGGGLGGRIKKLKGSSLSPSLSREDLAFSDVLDQYPHVQVVSPLRNRARSLLPTWAAAVHPAVSAVAAALAAAALVEVGVAGSPREVGGAVSWAAEGGVTVEGLVDRREGDLQEVEVASVAGSKAGSREEEVVGSHRWMVVVVDRADLLLLAVEADTALQVVVGVVS